MSVIRPKPPEDPIAFDPADSSAAAEPTLADLAANPDGLEQARDQAADSPLVRQPETLLADYNGTSVGRTRATSELYAVLQAARRIRDTADRVIVLGDVGTTRGVRAIFASCCHPFHNELSRGERGGRPRLSCVGHPADGDWLQGLVDLVAPAGSARGDDLLEQWAVVLCDSAPRAAADVLLPLLLQSVGGDRARLAERLATVTRPAPGDADADRVAGIGLPPTFVLPHGIGGGRGVFTAAVLLPAAIVGIDVVRLLQGAAAMNRRYREAAAAHNPVLQYVAASRRIPRRPPSAPRLVSADTERLRDVVHWHDQVGIETGGSALGLPEVAACVIELLAGEPRRDPLAAAQPTQAGRAPRDAADLLERLGDRLRDPSTAERPPPADAAVIRLPRIDEHAIGQLLQMLLLATVVEERLTR